MFDKSSILIWLLWRKLDLVHPSNCGMPNFNNDLIWWHNNLSLFSSYILVIRLSMFHCYIFFRLIIRTDDLDLSQLFCVSIHFWHRASFVFSSLARGLCTLHVEEISFVLFFYESLRVYFGNVGEDSDCLLALLLVLSIGIILLLTSWFSSDLHIELFVETNLLGSIPRREALFFLLPLLLRCELDSKPFFNFFSCYKVLEHFRRIHLSKIVAGTLFLMRFGINFEYLPSNLRPFLWTRVQMLNCCGLLWYDLQRVRIMLFLLSLSITYRFRLWMYRIVIYVEILTKETCPHILHQPILSTLSKLKPRIISLLHRSLSLI